MLRNEARELEDMNPIDGLDAPLVPLNVSTLDSEGNIVPTAPAPVQIRQLPRPIENRALASAAERVALRAGFVDQFREAAARNVRAESREILKNAKKHLVARRRPEFDEWLAGYYGGEFIELAQKNLEPIYRAYAEAVGPLALSEIEGADLPEGFDEIAESYAAAHAKRHAGSSRGQIRKALDEPEVDPMEAVEAELESWSNRAERDGKRNGVEAGEALARAVFVGAGFGLYWRAQGESCELCNALDGRRVGGSEPFLGAGETLSAEGTAPITVSNSITHAPLHDGCVCLVVPG
jgi:hypothetical protein